MSIRPTNRRGFLAGGSAAMLTGALLQTAQGTAREPHEPVRVAVVGTGGRGSDLIRALATLESARIVAVCDDYPPHLEKGRQYAGAGMPGFANYGRMLREAQPQAVVVATPLSLHFEMCMQALEAGCAVFCEKTMCHSIDQARELAAEVARREAVFQVGLQRRSNGVYRQAVAMVETGMLGDITAIKAQWHRNGTWRRPVPVDRDDPRFAELEHRLNWRLYWDWSQGLMTELGSHQVDVATWMLGRPPKRVLASGGIDHWRDGREVYDNVFCLYEYELPAREADAPPRTVRVTYSSLQNNAYEGASELIMGTRGTLFITQKKALFYREQGVEDPGWSTDGRIRHDAALVTSGKTLNMTNDPWAHRGAPYEMDGHGDDTRDELVDFLRSVATKNPATVCDVQTGLVNTASVLIANESIRTGQAVSFPADLAEVSS